jgi:polysaccharide biosynthesis transport protein
MDESADLDQGGLGLASYLEVIRRRKWIVLGVLGVAVLAATLFSLFWPPTYSATSKIVVGQGNSLFEPGQASAVQPFTATMRDLVESNIVASRVIRNLGLDETPEDLLKRVSVSINPETAVLTVTVEDEDPTEARLIAANIGDVFSNLVEETFGRPSNPSEPNQPPLTARVWDPARANPEQVSPKPKRDIPVAFALGAILGLLGAFLRDHFDRTLRTRESIERAFAAPVIGQIPFRRTAGPGAVFWDGAVSESFRALRANLQYLSIKHPLRTILVTSAVPEQGKTTVTANLAVAIARSGATTVAVECDLRRPGLTAAFAAQSGGRGLTNVLVGNATIEDALAHVPVPADLDAAGIRGRGDVWLVPSGPLPPNPSELLSSAPMRDLLVRLGETFDYVLLDSPPLLSVADTLELARIVDSVVLVVRRSDASTDAAREIRSLVERLGIELVGVVVTDVAAAFGTYGAYGEPYGSREAAQADKADEASAAVRKPAGS